MLFNSYLFIFLFLPIALSGYFLMNRLKHYAMAKYFLIGMSLWFYAYFNISYLGIITASIALNYLCHLLLLKRIHPKTVLTGGILGNLAILFYFKYFSFFVESISKLAHLDAFVPDILLPLGISFFTFQQLGFLIDTARGGVSRQSVSDYALFVTFFPQLIAGPIVSHEEMLPQFQDISKKSFCFAHFYAGLRLFILGLAKKVLLADTFGAAANWGFQHYASLDALNTLLVILSYTFQLYLDFSGYCDMARGLGLMFNIKIAVNFLSPYKAVNIRDFWDRWHITLSRFFTRYLYIPLGGSRKGMARTCLNILIVFLCSGIWHGAGWTFLLWGFLHGVFNVLTRIWQNAKEKRKHEKPLPAQKDSPIWQKRLLRVISVLLTFFFVMLTWTFFRADTIKQAVDMLKKLFSPLENMHRGFRVQKEIFRAFQLPELFYILKFFKLDTLPLGSCYCMFLFFAAAIILIFFCKNLYETENSHKPRIIKTVGLSVLFVWCVLSFSGVSTFLYFNF
ncbi:MAG: MBOAT family protein [Lachnospiraceae bacterium]